MTRSTTPLLLACLLATTQAWAIDGMVDRPAGPRENAEARRIAKGVGRDLEGAKVLRIDHWLPKAGSDDEFRPVAAGVDVTWRDLSILRLRYQAVDGVSAEDQALLAGAELSKSFIAYVSAMERINQPNPAKFRETLERLPDVGRVLVLEVRADELVLVRGKELEAPRRARQVLDLVWGGEETAPRLRLLALMTAASFEARSSAEATPAAYAALAAGGEGFHESAPTTRTLRTVTPERATLRTRIVLTGPVHRALGPLEDLLGLGPVEAPAAKTDGARRGIADHVPGD